ncbi:hypothetical protein BDV06DRAFT_224356 [Aspergillus oleicola]
MATGIECAGLVLAVLPLFVSAVDAYSKGSETLWGVIIRSKADEALHDFYCEFYYQIAILHKHLDKISDTVAGQLWVAGNGGSIASQLQDWRSRADIHITIRTLLGSDASFRMFETITTKIAKLLGQLIREPKSAQKSSRKYSHTDNEGIMFDRLKEFTADMDSHQTRLSAANAQRQLNAWREGTVFFKLATGIRHDTESRLRNLCESLDICVTGYRLRILMEHMTGHQSLWKLEPKPKRLCFLETEAPVLLDDLLDNHFVMSRAEKCGLGLVLTYSLLLFHDSPWNTMPWDKNKLSFFYKAADEPDYLRPFITTRFEQGNNAEVGHPGEHVFHRNYNILMLGILLIEVFMQAKIERFRTRQEQEEVGPNNEANINLKVAYRVVTKMDDAPHRAAIRACLELDWVSQGQRVRLEDPEVRKGLFVNVIEPLKREQGFAT